MTVSEELFERLCESRRIRCEPIPTTVGVRTADYKVWLSNLETIVEVKQIEQGEHEKQLLVSAENEEGLAIISDINTRVRNTFDKAKGQLRNLSGGYRPAILVLFDNTNGLSGMDNETFMNVMHGDEVLEIGLLKSGQYRRALQTFHTYGKRKRKVGKEHNRSVSALARLLVDETGRPMLYLFHNEFAASPLTTPLAELLAARQFVRRPSEQNEYRFWTEIRATDPSDVAKTQEENRT